MDQRRATKFGSITIEDALEHDGLRDSLSGIMMGATAENIATQFNVSRNPKISLLTDHINTQSRQQETIILIMR